MANNPQELLKQLKTVLVEVTKLEAQRNIASDSVNKGITVVDRQRHAQSYETRKDEVGIALHNAENLYNQLYEQLKADGKITSVLEMPKLGIRRELEHVKIFQQRILENERPVLPDVKQSSGVDDASSVISSNSSDSSKLSDHPTSVIPEQIGILNKNIILDNKPKPLVQNISSHPHIKFDSENISKKSPSIFKRAFEKMKNLISDLSKPSSKMKAVPQKKIQTKPILPVVPPPTLPSPINDQTPKINTTSTQSRTTLKESMAEVKNEPVQIVRQKSKQTFGQAVQKSYDRSKITNPQLAQVEALSKKTSSATSENPYTTKADKNGVRMPNLPAFPDIKAKELTDTSPNQDSKSGPTKGRTI